MLIRLGYDIEFNIPQPVAVVALLSLHPSREAHLREPDEIDNEPAVRTERFVDRFGNRCTRFVTPRGKLRLWSSTLVEDSAAKDTVNWLAQQLPVGELPDEVLPYLMNSRYCEVDRLSTIATSLFGSTAPGWDRVQAIVNWVHWNVQFGYQHARATRTALEVFNERVGVCRDFQHPAVALCRCMHVPARYATGYLGDIGVSAAPGPMDFSAWFEVYLDGTWWTFDARHNVPRIGRVLMARGLDAADVAMTTSYGMTELTKFSVVTNEVREFTPSQEIRSYAVGSGGF
ncbi:MAG: transglutaminase-like domain-containing protein [Candidatus Acidiferrales bacterium]